MNNIITKIILTVLSMVVIYSVVGEGYFSQASSLKTKEDEVNKLAKELEVIFEQASVYQGETLVGFDKQTIIDKIEGDNKQEIIHEFESKDLFVDKNNINNGAIMSKVSKKASVVQKRRNYYNKCIGNKLNGSYGPTAATAVFSYIYNKQYKMAAKKLIKLGIKGSVPGLIGNLAYIQISCGISADRKYYNRW